MKKVYTEVQSKLKLLLVDYLELGDESDLLDFIKKHPETISDEYGEYPDFHRITDITLGSKFYRVCRQISKNENISFIEVDELMDQMSGVPLWLEGEKLAAWSESDTDTNEVVNWEDYR